MSQARVGVAAPSEAELIEMERILDRVAALDGIRAEAAHVADLADRLEGAAERLRASLANAAADVEGLRRLIELSRERGGR
jgi:hypothetical protein